MPSPVACSQNPLYIVTSSVVVPMTTKDFTLYIDYLNDLDVGPNNIGFTVPKVCGIPDGIREYCFTVLGVSLCYPDGISTMCVGGTFYGASNTYAIGVDGQINFTQSLSEQSYLNEEGATIMVIDSVTMNNGYITMGFAWGDLGFPEQTVNFNTTEFTVGMQAGAGMMETYIGDEVPVIGADVYIDLNELNYDINYNTGELGITIDIPLFLSFNQHATFGISFSSKVTLMFCQDGPFIVIAITVALLENGNTVVSATPTLVIPFKVGVNFGGF